MVHQPVMNAGFRATRLLSREERGRYPRAVSEAQPIRSAIDDLVAEFKSVHGSERLELLIECGDDLPDLRTEFADASELGERVEECQSPVVLYSAPAGPGSDVFAVDITVPASAPVTRGFASIVQELADGRSSSDIASIPTDLTDLLGLTALVSPLRLTGMQALIGRLHRRCPVTP